MKPHFGKIFILISSVFLLVACNNKVAEHKGTLSIKDGSSVAGAADVAAHKAFDIDVYALPLMGMAAYKIVYYQTENDSVASHAGIYGDTTTVYNKADYIWRNDTVSVRLYSDTTKKEVKLKLYGKGGSNAMMQDN